MKRTGKYTQEEFIEEAKKINVDSNENPLYDYSKVEYINITTKVCIICPEHGEFWKEPREHLKGKGCPYCKGFHKTTDQFIKEAIKKHGNKYDYSKAEYVNATTKVCIIYPGHGEFWQTPHDHLSGYGYKKNWNRSSFIEGSIKKHGNKYDYSKVNYVNNHTKVCIICPEHGEFWQTPDSHLKGHGCRLCATSLIADKKRTGTEEFIKKANRIHHNKYDYSKVNYFNTDTKVCIICPEHGEFWQTPHAHLKGERCPYCYGNVTKDNDQFIKDAKKVHHDAYDYSKVEYINNKVPVLIICKKCGREFKQTPHNHLHSKQGCPYCNESKGEKRVKEWLNSKGLIINNDYVHQYRDKWLGHQSLDFYIPRLRVGIEYDGEQHYKSINIWGGDNQLKYIQELDKLKDELCKNENIELIRIPYTSINEIENILEMKLGEKLNLI